MSSEMPPAGSPLRSAPFALTSSWFVSAILHLLVCLVLGLIALPTSGWMRPWVLSLQAGGEAGPEPFTLDSQTIAPLDSTSIEQGIAEEEPVELLRSAPVVASEWSVAIENLTDSVRPTSSTEAAGDAAQHDQAMFFGASASGRTFVFILDVSGSMNARQGGRFTRARDELVASISKLDESQSFYVFLFNWSTFPMFGPALNPGKPIAATRENVDQLRAWLYTIVPDSGTDPRQAISIAAQMAPDAIFLLSDGRFNTPPYTDLSLGWDSSDKTVFSLVAHPEMPRIPIHSIAFEDQGAAAGMSRLAEITGGEYRFISALGQEDGRGAHGDPRFAGPEYEPQTAAEKAKLSADVLLIRRAQRMIERGRPEQARKLVDDLDPAKLPLKVRSQLEAILY